MCIRNGGKRSETVVFHLVVFVFFTPLHDGRFRTGELASVVIDGILIITTICQQ
jgi:hypothetical protein